MVRPIRGVLALATCSPAILFACGKVATDAPVAPVDDAGVALDGSSAASEASSSDVPTASSDAHDAATLVDASDASAPSDAGDASNADASDASDAGVSLSIQSTVKAATAVDNVGQDFGAPNPNGALDATVTATIIGAFDAVLWVSTDANGTAEVDAHQWDTVVGTEPLPNIDSGYALGNQTWTLAVANGSTVLNDGTGHVSQPAGIHTLTISVEATFKMTTGQHFRLYARQGTTWVAGPVFAW